MKQWMGVFMLLLAATMSFAPAFAAEGDTTTVEITTDEETEVAVDCVDENGNMVNCETLAATTSEVVADATTEDVAAASATAEVDEQTAHEVEAMGTLHGAQMRLLQLERHIRRSVVTGNEVIAQIETQANASANVTAGLEAIVVQLDALASEAEAARLSLGNSTNTTSQAAVAAFLDIKADAKALIKEFRDTAKPLLKASDAQRVKTRAEAKADDETEELEVEIEHERREHNGVRARVLLENIGEVDADLAAQIESGELTAEEIRAAIKARFDALTAEEKQAAAEKMREAMTKARVARADAVERVREEAGERAVLRLEERAEFLRSHNLTQAADMLERNAERIASRVDLTAEERAELRAELGGRLELREESRVREGGMEVRTERRERMRDGELEVRERTRVRVDNSGSDDSDEDEDETEDDAEVEVEVRT